MIIRTIITVLLIALAVWIVWGNGLTMLGYADDTPPETTASVDTTAVPETTSAPHTTLAPETTSVPDTTLAPETTLSPETTDIPVIKEYDYSSSVPERAPVEKSYFDDALFIGNSRTRGFLTMAGLSKPIAHAYVGLTVEKIFSEPVVQKGDTKITVSDAITESKGWSKVYIMLGTNEIGWVSDKAFINRYGDIIDLVRASNPDAVIYVQSILPVSAIYTPEHPDYYMYNMPKINNYNALLRALAEEKQVYYVDVAEVMTNEEGFLYEEASRDGVHINRDYCGRWLEYLMCHSVEVQNEKN